MAEKTHDPTPKRLREARSKGDVPQAPLVAGAIGLFALVALAGGTIERLAAMTARAIVALPQATARIDAWSLASTVIAAVAPIAIVLLLIAVAAGVAQGSVGFAPARLAPDPSRLDPAGGLGKLLDKTRWWNAARGLLVLLVASFAVARTAFDAVAARSDAITAASRAASRAVTITAAIACAFAVLDAIVARRLWLGRLRMTRDEVVREHKEGEGDPEVKRRREELHHELLAAEAVSAVRDATVLVVNPTHVACALHYRDDAGDEVAPTLVAKGHGALAQRMIVAARTHGVPIVRDVPVARALAELEVGTEIPEALYEAVAEVLRLAWEGGTD